MLKYRKTTISNNVYCIYDVWHHDTWCFRLRLPPLRTSKCSKCRKCYGMNNKFDRDCARKENEEKFRFLSQNTNKFPTHPTSEKCSSSIQIKCISFKNRMRNTQRDNITYVGNNNMWRRKSTKKQKYVSNIKNSNKISDEFSVCGRYMNKRILFNLVETIFYHCSDLHKIFFCFSAQK